MARTKRRVATGVVVVLMGFVLVAMAVSVSAVRKQGRPWSIWDWQLGGDAVAWGPGKSFDVHQLISLDGDETVAVTTGTGRVTIRGGGKPGEITLTAQVRARQGELSSETVDRLLGVSRARGEVQIMPADGFNADFGLFRFGTDGIRHLSVEVPDGVTVKVRTDTGRVILEGISGPAFVKTDVGAVEVNGIRGNLSVRTDVGRITVRDAEITGPLDLQSDTGAVEFQGIPGPNTDIRTDVGAVTLRVPGNRAYSLDLNQDVGRLHSDLPYNIETGRLGTGVLTGDLRISTSVGAVRIYEEGN